MITTYVYTVYIYTHIIVRLCHYVAAKCVVFIVIVCHSTTAFCHIFIQYMYEDSPMFLYVAAVLTLTLWILELF